ncbi:GTPase domain-containing protein [Iodobacter sp.]|uniref:GTPase domain-containing protein n=1 Tax=Iodobacter sp. TaxID=1915058 RepID=UPI0025E61660|nr:GTPase domain-containing protein [Iodobacter sp.]
MTKNELALYINAVPQLEREIKRLNFLQKEEKSIRIAVFGKYNHGKSTLLNTIVGEEVFKASDKRETTKNKTHHHKNITWVDTPGLDADVTGKDDKEAEEGAFITADILFLVHNLKAGELDRYENDYYHRLINQKKDYQRRIFLILTQADQVTAEQKKQIVSIIKKQLPDITTFVVSATRFTKGLAEKKQIFIEKSGIIELLDLTQRLSNGALSLRSTEILEIKNIIKNELGKKYESVNNHLQQEIKNKKEMKNSFSYDVKNFTTKVKERG